MKSKNSRLDAIKIIISSKEVGSQEELLQELAKEGFRLTQATLSRDLKQLKVAKAASMNGNYVYVLPNNTMYKRMTEQHSASEMLMHNGFISIEFSANLAVIKTRPDMLVVWLMILITGTLMKYWELLLVMILLCLSFVKAAQERE